MFLVINKKVCIMTLCIAVSMVLLGLGGTLATSAGTQKNIPIYSVERPDSKIALTFNCAWGNEDIEKILTILEEKDVKATFFVVGTWAEKYPEDLKKISSAGHEIAAHSYNHGHYKNMSHKEILADLEACDSAIEGVIEKDIYLVRGGYGEYTNSVIDTCEATGRTYIQWSVDSLDYKAESPDEIMSRVNVKTRPGDIILMHTGTKFTADALEGILDELCSKYSLVTVSDLIYKDNFIIDVTGKQKSEAE